MFPGRRRAYLPTEGGPHTLPPVPAPMPTAAAAPRLAGDGDAAAPGTPVLPSPPPEPSPTTSLRMRGGGGMKSGREHTAHRSVASTRTARRRDWLSERNEDRVSSSRDALAGRRVGGAGVCVWGAGRFHGMSRQVTRGSEWM